MLSAERHCNRSDDANYFDFPVRNTTNFFTGLTLLILIAFVLIPFLVGANVIVTVLVEFGPTTKEVTSTENGGLCFGPVTVTLRGPFPLFLTNTGFDTGTSPVVLKVRLSGDTASFPNPGVPVAVGVAVAVVVAVAVAVAVFVAVAFAVFVEVADAVAA